MVTQNCGVDQDLPPTALAMRANRDAMLAAETDGDDAQAAAQAAVRRYAPVGCLCVVGPF